MCVHVVVRGFSHLLYIHTESNTHTDWVTHTHTRIPRHYQMIKTHLNMVAHVCVAMHCLVRFCMIPYQKKSHHDPFLVISNWGCTYIFWLPQCKIAFPSAYWARPIRDLILVTPVSDHVVALVPVCTGENLTQVLMHMWRGGLSGTQIQGSLFASDIKMYIEMYSRICLGDVSY